MSLVRLEGFEGRFIMIGIFFSLYYFGFGLVFRGGLSWVFKK